MRKVFFLISLLTIPIVKAQVWNITKEGYCRPIDWTLLGNSFGEYVLKGIALILNTLLCNPILLGLTIFIILAILYLARGKI